MAICVICGRKTEQLLQVGDISICSFCEKHIVNISPGESNYDALLEKLKPFARTILGSYRKKDGREGLFDD